MGLAVPVASRVFAAHEADALRTVLEQQDEATELVFLDQPEQVCLDVWGKTLEGQRRYTVQALQRLCHTLCPGLFRVLRDVAGENPSRAMPETAYSLASAVQVFNRVVTLRFTDCLEGRQFVCAGSSPQTVDGLVSASYRRLPNASFLERLDELVGDDASIRFHAARLYGRRLSLEYLRREELWQREVTHRGAKQVDVYRGGYLFSNAEIGDSAVRGHPLVFRDWDGTVAVGSCGRAGSVRHAGRSFRRRFAGLLTYTLERVFLAGTLEEAVFRLEAEPLGVHESLDGYAECQAWLLGGLEKLGLTRRQCRLTVRGALLAGAFDQPERGAAPSSREAAGRSLFDLYVSLTRLAAASHVLIRERLIQHAYQLLIGASTISRRRTLE